MRIGTRGSALALAQARLADEALGSGNEIVTVRTTGDADPARSDKSKWVSELERALLDDEIDVAVHSAKDVPAELADGLTLAAVLPREDPRDALCGRRGDGLRVGTASLRRAAQLRALDPDVEIVALRGNVDTRLRKLADGEADGIVLALAGLKRLGLEDAVTEVLEIVPAACQGIVVLQTRTGTELPDIGDEETWRALLAERACVRALGADCESALGVNLAADGRLVAWVGARDGSAWLRDELAVHPPVDPETLGVQLAERLLSAGARELLESA